MYYRIVNIKNVRDDQFEYKIETPIELQYIFKHELQHFYHHDLWLNMLCEIIMCFYWWNPFAYFLKEKFKDMLEFANDKKITESMNEMEIYEYLECMLKIIKNNKVNRIGIKVVGGILIIVGLLLLYFLLSGKLTLPLSK